MAISATICWTSAFSAVLACVRLQGEEVQRQELEDLEVDIKKEEIRLLVLDYLVGQVYRSEVKVCIGAVNY